VHVASIKTFLRDNLELWIYSTWGVPYIEVCQKRLRWIQIRNANKPIEIYHNWIAYIMKQWMEYHQNTTYMDWPQLLLILQAQSYSKIWSTAQGSSCGKFSEVNGRNYR
jgi:hypothetical protein